MKQIFIAGNWKSNKGIAEAKEWLQQFNVKCQTRPPARQVSNLKWDQTTVVLCVPFTLLYLMKQEIIRLQIPIKLGAQDLSPYGAGAFTGEVNATQAKELTEWVIVGHSERRSLFGESDELLAKKVDQAKSAGLRIIYCVPDDKTIVPQHVDVIAYEPVWAIGTGKTDTPDNANRVCETIKRKTNLSAVIYGGSITSDNVNSFISMPFIDGVLPGGASLDPEKFYTLILKASSAT